MTSRDQPRAQAGDPQSPPRVSGDELFVPASHVLITDRQVSHPAFRLWCVLHRLWFLHEPPVMELLQELMGTTITDKATQAETWQPATRRSIERWLTELEQAGWLIWARRGETTRRYHLRTSARSATDTAILTELRTLLNSGKATLTEVQTLLNQAPQLPVDATPESHGSIPGSHQDAAQVTVAASDATPGSYAAGDDATVESHPLASWEADATVESHDPILASHDTTAESQDTTQGSHDTTAESHDATTPGSHGELAEGVLMRQNQAPYSEILQNEIHEDPTPPPAATGAPAGGDGGGLTATERFLLREGFSTRAAREFRNLDRGTVQADLERRRGLGQGIGAIVTTWRVEPPRAATPDPAASPAITRRATSAKAVREVVLDADARQIVALIIADGRSSEEQSVRMEQILGIGEVVVVDGTRPFSPSAADPEIVALRRSAEQITGKKVISAAGEHLGSVGDMYLVLRGAIIGFELKQGMFGSSEPHIIRATQIQAVGKDAVISTTNEPITLSALTAEETQASERIRLNEAA